MDKRTLCDNCTHSKVCKHKDSYLEIVEELENVLSKVEVGLINIKRLYPMCKHFMSDYVPKKMSKRSIMDRYAALNAARVKDKEYT